MGKTKIVLVLLGILFIAAACNKKPQQVVVQPDSASNLSSNEDASPAQTQTPVQSPKQPETKNIIVLADDYVAEPSAITVKSGTVVNLIIRVKSSSVYGLEYRSSVLSSGVIAPNGSETLTFTASQSFTLVPYRPNSSEQKNSKIDVTVE